MKFISLFGLYIWNVLKSIAALPWTLAVGLLRRLFLLTFHILGGPVYFVVGIIHGGTLLFNEPDQVMHWLGKGTLNILFWIGRIISKTLDVVLLGELLDMVFQVVKPNSRTLTDTELSEARKVFGNALWYWLIRIDEFSILAKMGAWFAKSSNMGVTTFHTINFTRIINPTPGSKDMEWLIHELAHVSQMEHAGLQYIVEALVAQNAGGYNYGGSGALEGKKLKDFNREQQAEIAADYYQNVLYGQTLPGPYLPLIEEFQDTRRLYY